MRALALTLAESRISGARTHRPLVRARAHALPKLRARDCRSVAQTERPRARAFYVTQHAAIRKRACSWRARFCARGVCELIVATAAAADALAAGAACSSYKKTHDVASVRTHNVADRSTQRPPSTRGGSRDGGSGGAHIRALGQKIERRLRAHARALMLDAD